VLSALAGIFSSIRHESSVLLGDGKCLTATPYLIQSYWRLVTDQVKTFPSSGWHGVTRASSRRRYFGRRTTTRCPSLSIVTSQHQTGRQEWQKARELSRLSRAYRSWTQCGDCARRKHQAVRELCRSEIALSEAARDSLAIRNSALFRAIPLWQAHSAIDRKKGTWSVFRRLYCYRLCRATRCCANV
jgi:hypothetical protein